VSLTAGLEIEHVMPRGWRTHWDPPPKLNPDAAAWRDKHVNTIGNLTPVEKSLNGSLSNRPWTNAEAAVLTESGKQARARSRYSTSSTCSSSTS
jgi:hypothetical protein